MVNISSLSKGLVAHYPLNGESETKDITPNANHGTNNGATLSTGRKGEANGSYYFDGTDDYTVSSGDLLPYGSSDRTITVWVKPNELLRSNILGYGQSTNGNMFDLLINDINGTVCGHFYGSTFDTITVNSPKLILNEWNLIAITYNGTTAEVYHNGIFANSKDVILNTLSSNFLIGKGIYMTGGVGSFKGNISDIRIYNRALEEDEIKLLYEKGRY